MTLSLLPTAAMAENEFAEMTIDGVTTQYNAQSEFLEALVGAVGKDIDIKLLDDLEIAGTVPIDETQTVTLDLNGHKLSTTVHSDNATKHYYAIDNYGVFTLKDTAYNGSIVARGIENRGKGQMIIESGKIVACDTNGGACIWNEAKLTVEGGTFETTHVGSSSDAYGVGCLNNSGTALITGGTFDDVNKRTYAIISTGDITITPAKGKAVNVSGAHGGLAIDSGTAMVNGGSYSSTDYYGLYVSNDGVGLDPMKAAVTVNGGTFTGPNYSVWIGSDYNDPVNSTIEINGGTFEKPLNAQECTREGAIVVKGGTFSSDPASYVADGYIATSANGKYTVRQRIPSELTTNIGETDFVVGVPTEFTYTTTANDDAGKMVVGTSDFSDAAAIEKLEYFEVRDGNWYELNGDFGSSAGFPMSDATSKFRVTFKTAGNYTFTSFMKLAGSDTVLCSTEVSFTVSDPTMQVDFQVTPANATIVVKDSQGTVIAANQNGGYDLLIGETYTYTVSASGYNTKTGSFVPSTAAGGNLVTVNLVRQSSGSSSSGSSSGSNTTTTTEKNPDGSTTTTTTDKKTGTVTEVTKETDGTTTTVETKKDGTVTETVKTPEGTTGTVVTDKDGDVTEVTTSVSSAAVAEAAETGEAVTLPVEVPAVTSTEDAPAVEITVPKSADAVKVEIPVENVTPGTVAVIVHEDGTEEIVSTSVVTEDGVVLTLDGSATVKVIDNSKDFVDVPETNVFYDEIASLSAREIMIGKTEDTFDLYGSVTLNQIANVAGRITGAVDVSNFNAGVVWGAENGMKTGNVAATRGDVLKALYIAAGSPVVEDTSILACFKDAAGIPADLAAIAAWAAQNGILKGDLNGNANLSANVTRGQACALAGRTMGTLA